MQAKPTFSLDYLHNPVEQAPKVLQPPVNVTPKLSRRSGKAKRDGAACWYGWGKWKRKGNQTAK